MVTEEGEVSFASPPSFNVTDPASFELWNFRSFWANGKKINGNPKFISFTFKDL